MSRPNVPGGTLGILANNNVQLILSNYSYDYTKSQTYADYCCKVTTYPLYYDNGWEYDDTVSNIFYLDISSENLVLPTLLDNNYYLTIQIPNSSLQWDSFVEIAIAGRDEETGELSEYSNAVAECMVFCNNIPTINTISVGWDLDNNEYKDKISYSINPGYVNPIDASNLDSYISAFNNICRRTSGSKDFTIKVYRNNINSKPLELEVTTSTNELNDNVIMLDGNSANNYYYWVTIEKNNNISIPGYAFNTTKSKDTTLFLGQLIASLLIQKNGIKVNSIDTDNDNSSAIKIRKTGTNTASGNNIALYDDTQTNNVNNNQPNIAFCSNNVLAADMRLSDSALMLKHRGRDYYDTIVTASDLNELNPTSISATDISVTNISAINVSATNVSATNASISNATITNLSVTHMTNDEVPVGGIYKGASEPTYGTWEQIRQESLIHLGIARVMCGNRIDESKIIQNKDTLSYFYNGYVAASQYKGIFNSGELNFRRITESNNNYFCCELNDNYTITKIHVNLHLSGAFVSPSDNTTATDGVIWFSRIANDDWTGWPTSPPSSNPWIVGGTIHHFPSQTHGWHSATHEYWVYQSFNDITKAITIDGTTTSVIPIPDGYTIHAASSGNFWFCRNDIGSNLMVEVYGYPNQWRRTG